MDLLEVVRTGGVGTGVLRPIRQVRAVGADASRYQNGVPSARTHVPVAGVEGQSRGGGDNGTGLLLGEPGSCESGKGGLIRVRADDASTGIEIVRVDGGDGLGSLGQLVRRVDPPGVELSAHGTVQDHGAALHQLGQAGPVERRPERDRGSRMGSHGDTLIEARTADRYSLPHAAGTPDDSTSPAASPDPASPSPGSESPAPTVTGWRLWRPALWRPRGRPARSSPALVDDGGPRRGPSRPAPDPAGAHLGPRTDPARCTRASEVDDPSRRSGRRPRGAIPASGALDDAGVPHETVIRARGSHRGRRPSPAPHASESVRRSRRRARSPCRTGSRSRGSS